jgi:hypothetical protein
MARSRSRRSPRGAAQPDPLVAVVAAGRPGGRGGRNERGALRSQSGPFRYDSRIPDPLESVDVVLVIDKDTYEGLWLLTVAAMATYPEHAAEYRAAGYLRNALDVQTDEGKVFES